MARDASLMLDTSQSINAPRSKPNSARRCLPTFLGIGSMRCGSTWLYQVLRCHPDIRLSDRKEMDFFFMYRMLQHDLNWYEAQFAPENGGAPKPVRGEISPLYARLKEWQVRRIADLLPNLRIILTLRHPIERVWSQALMEFGHHSGRDVREVGAVEFLRQVERPRNVLSSDYCRTIKIWSGAFGREALHIDLFDRLRGDPQGYVNDILRHIVAATPWALPAKFIKQKVHATNSLVEHEREIPEAVQWYIADRFLEPTERLNELLGGWVSSWVEEMRTIRGKTRLSWRILRDVNRSLLSVPERAAYEAYHAALDARLWLRWRQLQRSYVSALRLV
ncbi:MAG TPA: sulfotransferase [Terriglobales bacterium]|nr:sulfotransferase [Terriglobales bacterium]